MSVSRRSTDSETAVVELLSHQELWAGKAVTSLTMMYVKIEFGSTSFGRRVVRAFLWTMSMVLLLVARILSGRERYGYACGSSSAALALAP